MRDLTRCPGPGTDSCLAVATSPSKHYADTINHAKVVGRTIVRDAVKEHGANAEVTCKLCGRLFDLRLACPGCVNDPWPDGYGMPRECAFMSGTFEPHNWACASLSDLKSHIIKAHDRHPYAQLGAVSVTASYWADVTMYTWAIDRGDDPNDPLYGRFLVMTCYKGRGAIGQAWILGDDGDIRSLTLTDVERIFENVRNGRGAL